MGLFIVNDRMTGWNYLVRAEDSDTASKKFRASLSDEDVRDSYLQYIDAVKRLNDNIIKTNEDNAAFNIRYGEDLLTVRNLEDALCPFPTYEEWIEDYEIVVEGEFVMESDIVNLEDTIIAEFL